MLSKLVYFLSISFLFVGCGGLGTDFFIRNHHKEAVEITYQYVRLDSIPYDYAPCLQIKNNKGLLKNRKLQREMTKSDANNSMVFAKRVDSSRYTLTIPARSTIYIKPVYQYGNSIKQLVIHNNDSILFKEEYPGIINQEYFDDGAYKHKYRLIGKSYEVFDIKNE